MLIDCHVHLNNYHADRKIPTEVNCRELFAKMDERGVDDVAVDYLDTKAPNFRLPAIESF